MVFFVDFSLCCQCRSNEKLVLLMVIRRNVNEEKNINKVIDVLIFGSSLDEDKERDWILVALWRNVASHKSRRMSQKIKKRYSTIHAAALAKQATYNITNGWQHWLKNFTKHCAGRGREGRLKFTKKQRWSIKNNQLISKGRAIICANDRALVFVFCFIYQISNQRFTQLTIYRWKFLINFIQSQITARRFSTFLHI